MIRAALVVALCLGCDDDGGASTDAAPVDAPADATDLDAATPTNGSDVRSGGGGVERRGTRREGDLLHDDAIAYERRRTDLVRDQRALYFDLGDRFRAPADGPLEVKVPYLDHGPWRLEWDAGECGAASAPIESRGDGATRTATIPVGAAALAGGLPDTTDLRVVATGDTDVEVRMVRVVRAAP